MRLSEFHFISFDIKSTYGVSFFYADWQDSEIEFFFLSRSRCAINEFLIRAFRNKLCKWRWKLICNHLNGIHWMAREWVNHFGEWRGVCATNTLLTSSPENWHSNDIRLDKEKRDINCQLCQQLSTFWGLLFSSPERRERERLKQKKFFFLGNP